jgi:hypothetical protein
MTELTLIEKLRLAHVTTGQRMLGEAADRIEALEAALKPFADTDCPEGLLIVVKTDDLRLARKALGEKP